MKKYRIRVGLDVDDTLYSCNAYALSLINSRHPDEPPININEITGWGRFGRRADERIALYGDPEFVRTQPILPGAQKLVRELNKFADVFFITAVPARCMSARAERLIADFPEIPSQNIIIGTRKDVIALDILLDDAAHNIANSRATYPVLLRQPWNTHLSGLLSVNSYEDFLHVCKLVRSSFTEKSPDLSGGGVVCLVGPSGTYKNEIAALLTRDERFERPVTTTTRPRRAGEDEHTYRFLTDEEFLRERDEGRYIETTVYSRYHFATSFEAIEPIVTRGHCAVIPIDICGAVTIKNLFKNRAMLVFTNRPREDVLLSLVRRELPDEDKVRRILALEYEYRNVQWCDAELDVGNGPADAAARLATMLTQ